MFLLADSIARLVRVHGMRCSFRPREGMDTNLVCAVRLLHLACLYLMKFSFALLSVPKSIQRKETLDYQSMAKLWLLGTLYYCDAEIHERPLGVHCSRWLRLLLDVPGAERSEVQRAEGSCVFQCDRWAFPRSCIDPRDAGTATGGAGEMGGYPCESDQAQQNTILRMWAWCTAEGNDEAHQYTYLEGHEKYQRLIQDTRVSNARYYLW